MTFDVSGVLSALTGVGTAVAAVGGGMLLAYVGIKAFKMIRAAL